MRTPQLRSIPYIRVLHNIVQWNLSNPDTNGAEESVLFREVSSFQRLKMHARVVLGVGKGVLFREVSIYTQNLVAQYKSVSLSLTFPSS